MSENFVIPNKLLLVLLLFPVFFLITWASSLVSGDKSAIVMCFYSLGGFCLMMTGFLLGEKPDGTNILDRVNTSEPFPSLIYSATCFTFFVTGGASFLTFLLFGLGKAFVLFCA